MTIPVAAESEYSICKYSCREVIVLRKVKSATTVAALTLILSSTLPALAAQAQQPTPQSVMRRAISLNGQTVSQPYSFVYDGTTYMPIWYVMQVLDSLHIENSWKGPSVGWNITAPGVTATASATQNHTGIFVNLIRAEDAPTQVYRDPASGKMTTFMPIWYVMQVLSLLQIQSTWKDGVWNLVPPTATSTSAATLSSAGGSPTTTLNSAGIETTSGSLTIDGVPVPKLALTNQATDDSSYWARASNDLYVSAQTNDPSTQTGTPILSAQPNQPLYLFAYKNDGNVESPQTQWVVNSPLATVTGDSSQWTEGKYDIAKASFTATVPGVYTVQAEAGGAYSVPLVIVVGESSLSSQPLAIPASSSGVLPLPQNLPPVTALTQDQVTYSPYPADNGWIPVSGSTTLPVTAMTVVMQSTGASAQTWDYRIPVVNGQFSALLMPPFTGQVQVTLFPDYLKTLSKLAESSINSYTFPNSAYTVNVQGTPPSPLQAALFATSQSDYNNSPRFNAVASALLENSPSIDTAIAAISNYVSESIVYNDNEIVTDSKGNTPNYVYQENLAAWQSGSGICQDYASLTVALLQSVGIPAQLVGGYANDAWSAPPSKDTNAGDAHAWVQAWNGTQWVVMDPTWNDDSLSVDSLITSEFMTATASLDATHLLEASQTGIPVSHR